MDILLDKDTGDILFDNGTTVTSTKDLDLSQRLRIRLGTFNGEWFLDTDFGVPWFQQILGKQRSKATVDSIIQEEIYKEHDVRSIKSFTSEWDRVGRSYRMTAVIEADDRSLITLTNTPTGQFTFTTV